MGTTGSGQTRLQTAHFEVAGSRMEGFKDVIAHQAGDACHEEHSDEVEHGAQHREHTEADGIAEDQEEGVLCLGGISEPIPWP